MQHFDEDHTAAHADEHHDHDDDDDDDDDKYDDHDRNCDGRNTTTMHKNI